MSRIGKKPIVLPEGVSATVTDRVIQVKGPKGTLEYNFGYEVDVKVDGTVVTVEKVGRTKLATSLWGTTRALIQNMVTGVKDGFSKKLELYGVGYKMALQGRKITMSLGFSHPVEVKIPEGIEVKIEKESMEISGIDRQKVGQFAADIRALKPVEPYKGKGFRYSDEQVVKKEGKKAAGAE